MDNWTRFIAKLLWRRVPVVIVMYIMYELVYNLLQRAYIDHLKVINDKNKNNLSFSKLIQYKLEWIFFGPFFVSWCLLSFIGLSTYLFELTIDNMEVFIYNMIYINVVAVLPCLVVIILNEHWMEKLDEEIRYLRAKQQHKLTKIEQLTLKWNEFFGSGVGFTWNLVIIYIYLLSHY
jgi:hypothetical protein